MDLKDKHIIITGVSKGIGLELSKILVEKGCNVYGWGRNAPEWTHERFRFVKADIQNEGAVNYAAAQTLEMSNGRVDGLVNNAGLGYFGYLEKQPMDEIDAMVKTNIMGVIYATRSVLGVMKGQQSGHIINISSVGGLVGQPFNEVYCAAKFAVEGLTESLASYVTPGFGVRFTSIQPGGITSEFANSILKQVEATGGLLEDDYLPLLQRYIGTARARMGGDAYQSSAEAAAVVLACLEQEDPPLRLRTSDWAEQFCTLKTAADPDGLKQQAATIEVTLGL